MDSLHELRLSLRDSSVVATNVSHWSIGLHVHHCILVNRFICRALRESTTSAPTKRWNPVEAFIFTSGWIPRGRGKASNRVTPDNHQPEVLMEALAESEKEVESAEQLAPGHWVRHPVFGVLTKDKALRFIEIHTRHHVKIIRDIQKAAP